jgi:hypothetical protein
MTPTMYLRINRVRQELDGGRLVMFREGEVLQQFWHIAPDESDITLPKVRGPDGEFGRWIDVPRE